MLQHRIDLPAGSRPMSKEDPRPEFVGRPDFFRFPEAVEAAQKGVEFGLMLMAPDKLPADFDPSSLGCKYGMHIANEVLTKLYAAHLKGDEQAESVFYRTLERFAIWNPAPDYAVFHLGGTGMIPTRLDEHRFDVIQSPANILKHLVWLRRTFKQILEVLPCASPENIGLDQYVGPPRWGLGDEWLPMTCQEDRRGGGPDIAYVLADTSGRATFDLEHARFSRDSLNGTGIEQVNRQRVHVWELDGAGEIIYAQTGLLYVQGKPLSVATDITEEQMISALRPRQIHVGGIHPAVVELTGEGADNPYYRHLQQVLPPEVWEQVKFRRVGSHASIREDDEELKHGVIIAIRCGAEVSALEIASYGEAAPKDGSSPGCWYWQPKNALEESFKAYCRMLPDLMIAAQS